ncbi:type II toxin-antitoxin system Phd/YefM family antitoxin [Micromonospora sp. NPDC051300]|uniref:type II toxin-antitoxin system Phd/YefM family antitoxin n=1 Tax=Micromonospora sp. NPDC051300 TaxID=3364286 RepID=UPI00378F2BC2
MSWSPAELSIAEVRSGLSRLVNRVHVTGEITYVRDRGQRLAAIVPADVAEAFERAEDALDVAAGREALARIAAGEVPLPLIDETWVTSSTAPGADSASATA